MYANINTEITIDGKGRISLPTDYRRSLPDGSVGFHIKKSLAMDCLELYPKNEWEKVVAQLSHLNPLNPDDMLTLSLFFDGGNDLEMDNSGRLVIPKSILELANIEESKPVLFKTVMNTVCIWDKETFMAFAKQNAENAKRAMTEEFGRKKTLKYTKN